MANAIQTFYQKITAVFHKLGGNIQQELTQFEHDFLQQLHPLMRQIEATGGSQLMAIIRQVLTTVIPTVLAGGGWGAVVSAAAPLIFKELGDDLTLDAKNAVHGGIQIVVAQLQTEMATNAALVAANPPVAAPAAETEVPAAPVVAIETATEGQAS